MSHGSNEQFLLDSIADSEKQRTTLIAKKKHMLPTAKKGMWVYWYPKGLFAEENAYAALVTLVEAPGS